VSKKLLEKTLTVSCKGRHEVERGYFVTTLADLLKWVHACQDAEFGPTDEIRIRMPLWGPDNPLTVSRVTGLEPVQSPREGE
jgi:hypothetical protein